jgi:hypothetical protein
VSDTVRELADVSGLVATRETEVVVGAVDLDVLEVALLELLDHLLDGLHAALGTGLVRRVVGVASGAVPVTLEGLGVERDGDAPLLSDADEEEAGEPEVVTHVATLAGTDLELPLRRHDLGVDTRDEDTGVKAGAVVSLDHVASEDLAGSDTTVVRTLGTGETSNGPSVRTTVVAEDGVLLLETEL